MKTTGQRVASQKACTTHGNMKQRRVLHSINHTTSFSTLPSVELMDTSQMVNVENNGLTLTHMPSTPSGTLNQLGAKPGNQETPLFKLTT